MPHQNTKKPNKSKNGLHANISSIVNLSKIIIFDQDGTFYSREKPFYKYLSITTKNWIKEKLKISDSKINFFYKKLINRYPNPLIGFKSLGLSISDYHNKVFANAPMHLIKKNPSLIKLLYKTNSKKYVVTFSPSKYSKLLQEKIGIRHLIKKTYCFSETNKCLDKVVYYRKIRRENSVKPQNILVIGDNFINDIKPAITYNFMAILINHALKKEIEYKKNYIIIRDIKILGKFISLK